MRVWPDDRWENVFSELLTYKYSSPPTSAQHPPSTVLSLIMSFFGFTQPTNAPGGASRFAGIPYVVGDELGSGSYASVYKARCMKTNTFVAMKAVELNEDGGLPANSMREVALMKEVCHPNVLGLLNFIPTAQDLLIFSELCEWNLREYMKQHGGRLTHETTQSFMSQLLSGLEYLHSKSILHRDLKSPNLLIKKDLQLKIADFGLSKVLILGPLQAYDVATLWYRSPDVLMGSRTYGTSIDMWSSGCLFVEMFLGDAPFRGKTEAEQLMYIVRVIGTPNQQVLDSIAPDYETEATKALLRGQRWDKTPWEVALPRWPGQALSLIDHLMQFDPAARISAADAVKHPYFSGDGREAAIAAAPVPHYNFQALTQAQALPQDQVLPRTRARRRAKKSGARN